MRKEKQTYNPCDDCQYSYSKNGQESGMCKICEFTYFKDRKQSEGEWIVKGECWKTLQCSACGHTTDTIYDESPFCPNCGAKMKGGAE